MAIKIWQPLKIQFCEHVDGEVTLEAEAVYAVDILSDQPPRLLAHRCSRGFECAMDKTATCKWAGTNPGYDPFQS